MGQPPLFRTIVARPKKRQVAGPGDAGRITLVWWARRGR